MSAKKFEMPVYEFRPLPDFFVGEVRRFNGGLWTPDDGAHDLAFIGEARSAAGWTFSCCLYFDPPYQKNIICSWRGGPHEPQHPNANPWHYALRGKARVWGGDWGRDRHENYRAGNAGMCKKSSESGCCNGRHVEFDADDEHIAAGLLRERDTGKVFEWPSGMVCMYCGDVAPVQAATRIEP